MGAVLPLLDAEDRYGSLATSPSALKKDKGRKPTKSRKTFDYQSSKMPEMGLKNKKFNYEPSEYALAFHNAPHRFRYLCWGIKSGKSYVGAVETARTAIRYKNIVVWVIGATNWHTEEAERMVLSILDAQQGIIISRQENKRRYVLYNGTVIQFRSGVKPNNLRGPNVHFAWVDEAAFLSEDCFREITKRTAVTKGRIICTTTPYGKNWYYEECIEAGMPASGPYGEFSDEKGRRWCSHRKTSEFPWVDEEELDDHRKRMSKLDYEQEFEAKYTARANAAFKKINFHYRPCIFKTFRKYIIGVDLGKEQDYTAVVVLDNKGFVVYCKRWKDIDYPEQVIMLRRLSKDWGDAPLIVDASNVGKYVVAELTKKRLTVYPVDLNSPKIKIDIVQATQVALESGNLHIPHPESEFAPPDADILRFEVEEYRVSLTEKNRLSFSAPKGAHDDMAVSLCLAQWGKVHGFQAAGKDSTAVAESVIPKDRSLMDMARQRRINRFSERRRRVGRVSNWLARGGESSPWMGRLHDRRAA